MAVRVFHRDRPSLRLPLISRDARFVVWLGTGARTANMNYVVMESGEQNIPHIHVQSEDTIFILEGAGSVRDFDNDTTLEFKAGQIIHVPVGIKHAVRADRGVGVVSVGGPCPADRELLRKAGVLPDGL
jgi:quercetin dioxygenase-like cupin family protein